MERIRYRSASPFPQMAGHALRWQSVRRLPDKRCTTSEFGSANKRPPVTRIPRTLVALVLVPLAAIPAAGQWPRYPVSGIPRTPDGKPDLGGPVPRLADGKPDLSGMWLLFMSTAYTLNIVADERAEHTLPWAAAY